LYIIYKTDTIPAFGMQEGPAIAANGDKMNLAAQASYRLRVSQVSLIFLLSSLAIVAGFMSGCTGNPAGASVTSAGNPPPMANTLVTVLVSSKANDQLTRFFISLSSITLSDNAGQTINLLQTSQETEFIHLNGNSAPLVTASVPQGVYTSAGFSFTNPLIECLTLSPTGGLVESLYAYQVGKESATVNLASPLTISGNAMELSLELQAAESETLSGCTQNATYSITPVFNLSPVTIASAPSNDLNGKMTGIRGRVASLSAGGFTAQTTNGESRAPMANGPSLAVTVNGNTVYRGVSGLPMLSANMFVDMDAVIQSEGSLLASRIEVDDPTALNAIAGPMLFNSNAESVFIVIGRQVQGDDLSVLPINIGYFSFSGSTVFQISPSSQPFQGRI
jgi:hypothetical protein